MDRDRAEATRTVVAELSPDILVLNEALFCRQHAGKEVDYAALFGFRDPHGARRGFSVTRGHYAS